MGRPERPLDPADGPVQAFAVELRRLRERAGMPKYRSMARAVHRSPTALSEAAGGRRLPTWSTVEAFVRACGDDPERWRAPWEEAAGRGAAPEASVTDAPAGPAEAEVGAGREGLPEAASRPRRGSIARAVAVSGAATGAVASAVLLWQLSTDDPPPAPPPVTQGIWSGVADGADPKDTGCSLDPDATTLDSAEVDVDGQPAGMVELRYSPRCGVAWPRFTPFPLGRIPRGDVIRVTVVRPDDGVVDTFSLGYVGEAIWGNVLRSTGSCVYVEGGVGRPGSARDSRTSCFRGTTLVRLR